MAYERLDEIADLFQFASLLASSSTTTVRDLMGLRNKLLDERSKLAGVEEDNPETMRIAADINQLIASINKTIDQSLPPEGRETWLKATAISKELSETYENPSSIFYHAVRTDNPSTLPSEFADWLLASPTTERVKMLRDRLGDEGFGIIQRAVSEKLLGQTETGEFDLRGFPDRLEHLDEGFREELFGPHHKRYKDIAISARVVTADDGRSKSSKGIQKQVEIGITIGLLGAAVWEAWKGHPWAAGLMIAVPVLYHTGQYIVARLLHSQKFTDWLMTPNPKK